MTIRADAAVLGVVETVTLTKRDAATGRVDEVIESGPGRAGRVLLRRAGAAPESYARMENQMVAMRMRAGGSAGGAVYEAGEDVEVDIDHAKRVFLLDHGDVLDKPGGRKLTVKKAAAVLRLRPDDLAGAVPRIATTLRAAFNAKGD